MYRNNADDGIWGAGFHRWSHQNVERSLSVGYFTEDAELWLVVNDGGEAFLMSARTPTTLSITKLGQLVASVRRCFRETLRSHDSIRHAVSAEVYRCCVWIVYWGSEPIMAPFLFVENLSSPNLTIHVRRSSAVRVRLWRRRPNMRDRHRDARHSSSNHGRSRTVSMYDGMCWSILDSRSQREVMNVTQLVSCLCVRSTKKHRYETNAAMSSSFIVA